MHRTLSYLQSQFCGIFSRTSDFVWGTLRPDNMIIELSRKVVNQQTKLNGVGNPSNLPGMANLASTYRNQGRWKEAQDLEVQVVETRKTVLGVEHPDPHQHG